MVIVISFCTRIWSSLKTKEIFTCAEKKRCLADLKALELVEVVDLFKNFVHRSDDAGLGAGEAVTVIFQPGGERSEGTVTVTTVRTYSEETSGLARLVETIIKRSQVAAMLDAVDD